MPSPLKITALSGGVGGARFLRGLTTALAAIDDPALRDAEITVVANTGDDITLHGLRVQPDVDSILYTLGGGVNEEQGWGRADETHAVGTELAALGAAGTWFTLGDKDFATHILRSQLLGQGATLSQVVAHLATRWGLPEQRVALLPMSDTPVETHVVLEQDGEQQAVHFQEWWVRLQAATP
ncbi:2-phospho-L-lactate transferase CofD family protein, partial [Kribbia dieselivorans]|uniref:2-phospho-L-lactate transferase CofD family protein n=1 Tax=Kribbia dieselivorans TaxID=331526 RepID=UPI000A8A9CCC